MIECIWCWTGRLLSGVLLAAAAALLQVAHAATPKPCPQGEAVVVSATTQDYVDICHGAAAAVGFFETHGVWSHEPVLQATAGTSCLTR